jgi:hypothetical protein
MPVYYYRPGNLGPGNYNITDNRWSTSSSPAAGTITPTTGDFASTANEFVIDNLSGGSSTNIAIINITASLTIAKLSFGASSTAAFPTSCIVNPLINIAASVVLTISEYIQFPSGSSGIIGSVTGNLRLNTNTTGKILILKNCFTGRNNVSLGGGGIQPFSLAAGPATTSVIEFAGTSNWNIKSHNVTTAGDTNTAIKVIYSNTFASGNTTYTSGTMEFRFNKSGSSTLLSFVNNFLYIYSIVSSNIILKSDYDATAKASFPNRYGGNSEIKAMEFRNPFSFPTVDTPCTITTDTKELIFVSLYHFNSYTLINTGSPFKLNSLIIGGLDLTIPLNSTLEILNTLGKVVTGQGLLKFSGSGSSTITNTTAINNGLLFDINVEINKTVGSSLTAPYLYWGFNNVYVGETKKTFKHISGNFICTQLDVVGESTTKTLEFIGGAGPAETVASKLLLYSSDVSPLYEINTTAFRVGTLEISSKRTTAGDSLINFLGNRGFTAANFIHTSSTDNAADKINVVTLSNNTAALYTVTNSITMLGLASRRAVLQGDPNRLNFTASASGVNLTTSTSQSLTNRHYISQSPSNTGQELRVPLFLNAGDISVASSFAKIQSGSGTSFTLSRNVQTISSRGMQAGIPAAFRFTGSESSLNMNYITIYDIDGSGGTMIKALNSRANVPGIASPNLWRAINLNSNPPLLPHIVAGYVE